MMELQFTLVSPERSLCQNLAVRQVTLPGCEGQIQILPDHIDFVSTLMTGVFYYTLMDGKQHFGALSTGFVEVRQNRVRVFAHTAERAEDIDHARAVNAQRRAEEKLQGNGSARKYELKLQRALVRQQASRAAQQ